MLLLTRRVGESIILTSKKSGLGMAETTVTEIQPGQAKIEVVAAAGVYVDSYETQRDHLQWVPRHGVIVLSDQVTGAVLATVHNCGINGNQVRVGVNAGSDVIIHRNEIQKLIIREAKQRECLLSA